MVQQPHGRPHLITKSISPENQETPIHFIESDLVIERLFYRRNHFSYPSFVSSFYLLPVSGSVQHPRVFSLQEILSLPAKTIKVVLECAGNNREQFNPKVFGEQWGKGAISQGIWKGVPLRTLLTYTGLIKTAKEVIFEGYDFGERTDSNQLYPYARSLPLAIALHPDTIIAYEYNEKPIPFKHGYPMRLIVPGWYAMASVKWIKSVTVIDKEFKGPYQAIDYIYYPMKENDSGKKPVTTINVNSTIQKPLNREILNTGHHKIAGIAWTGKGNITKVEISLDGGLTWQLSNLTKTHENSSWVRWAYRWEVDQNGEYTILSKATDSGGRVQPQDALWNRKGYGYNAIDSIIVKVE